MQIKKTSSENSSKAVTFSVRKRATPDERLGGAGGKASFHCPEAGLPFLAIWYSLGIAAAATVGALLGKTLLRW
jgi:cytochrome oxidase assembly protein ShyY1